VSHGEFLRAVTKDHALVAALQQDDWTLAALDDADRALLEFARKLNACPGEVAAEDLERLRAAGYSDQNAFDAVMIVAYFNFMNRVADGVGVAPETSKVESYERHLQEVLAARRQVETGGSA